MIQNQRINVTSSFMPPYEEYIKAIKPLWESHRLTNMGEYHNELERQLKEYLSVPGVSLIVNGHMALELAIQSFSFPENAEVITTPFTFISTTHAIVRNHLKPIFCDVKLSDGTIDESKIEDLISEHTVAIVPVHVYGHVCNIEEIQRIADKYNLKVIYDSAHAFGVSYLGKGIGNYGDAAIFSFHATKIFNTIEGGAVTFSDYNMYQKLYDLKNFGIRNEELVVGVGANAKMNEFSAIMGLCNLRHIEEAYAKRRRTYELYKSLLSDIDGIKVFEGTAKADANYAYFPIIVEEEYKVSRNELYEMLIEKNIFARKYFYPLTSQQACFKNKYRHIELDNAKRLADNVLVLPFHADLEKSTVERIVEIIKG